jgi:hypothetical protein
MQNVSRTRRLPSTLAKEQVGGDKGTMENGGTILFQGHRVAVQQADRCGALLDGLKAGDASQCLDQIDKQLDQPDQFK